MEMQIKDIRPGLKNITVMFIVLEVGHPTVTKENREVRNFKVADMSACINVSIWDEPGQLLVPGDIVRLTKCYASVWRNCLTLYSGKTGDIQKIGEFTMVFNEQLNMSEPNPALAAQLVNQSTGSTNNNNNLTGNNNGNTNNGGLTLGRHSVTTGSQVNTPSSQTNSTGSGKGNGGGNNRFGSEPSAGSKTQGKSNQRKGTHRNSARGDRR